MTPSGLTAMGIGLWSSRLPQSQEERQAEALLIGREGSNLLTDLYAAEAPAWLRAHPSGRDPALHLDPKLRLGRRAAPLAKQRQSSSGQPVHQLAL